MGEGKNDICCQTRELLPAFLDDELPSDVSHAIQEHLDACERCRGFARLEEGFTRALRARLPRVEAPDALIDRALGQLDDPRPARAPRRASWAGRIVYGLAAAIFGAVALAPAMAYLMPDFTQGLFSTLSAEAHIRGVLVCVECERHGVSLEAQRRCRVHGHQTGVRCPETGLWHLVSDSVTAPLISDPELRGRTVELEARKLSDVRYLQVTAATIIAGS